MTNENNQPYIEKVKVSITDDDHLYRETLKKLLSQDDRIIIYAEYSSGKDFLKSLKSPFKPDTCLLDIVLGDISGVDCAKEIKDKWPEINVILMTAYPDPKTLTQARNIGADYIEKGTLGEILINKIIAYKRKTKNEQLISLTTGNSKASDLLFHLYKRIDAAQRRVAELSTNQKRSLELRQEGRSREEIAEILGISIASVRTHCHRAYKKLELPNLLDFIDFKYKP